MAWSLVLFFFQSEKTICLIENSGIYYPTLLNEGLKKPEPLYHVLATLNTLHKAAGKDNSQDLHKGNAKGCCGHHQRTAPQPDPNLLHTLLDIDTLHTEINPAALNDNEAARVKDSALGLQRGGLPVCVVSWCPALDFSVSCPGSLGSVLDNSHLLPEIFIKF